MEYLSEIISRCCVFQLKYINYARTQQATPSGQLAKTKVSYGPTIVVFSFV